MSNNQAIDRETLVAGGFVPTRYEGQEGEFLVKRVPIRVVHVISALIFAVLGVVALLGVGA